MTVPLNDDLQRSKNMLLTHKKLHNNLLQVSRIFIRLCPPLSQIVFLDILFMEWQWGADIRPSAWPRPSRTLTDGRLGRVVRPISACLRHLFLSGGRVYVVHRGLQTVKGFSFLFWQHKQWAKLRPLLLAIAKRMGTTSVYLTSYSPAIVT